MSDYSLTELRQKLLLTPKEFGLLIGTSESSARKIIRRENLPTVEIYDGAGIRVPQAVAIAWIEKRQQQRDAKIRQYAEDMQRIAKMAPTRRKG